MNISLIMSRGSKGSYKEWADTVDDQSFTFESLLHFFKRSPNFTTPNLSKLPPGDNVSYDASAFSGSDGPLHVSYSNYRQTLATFITTAMGALGVEPIPGLSSGDLIGYAQATLTIDLIDETRSSSETSFLRTAIASSSSSLQVYHSTFAKRILFDGNKRATGVMVATAGDSYLLSARKEVIVAAGVVSPCNRQSFLFRRLLEGQFKAPQLLMISGIGPATVLQGLQIPVLSDLAGVGQKLWV